MLKQAIVQLQPRDGFQYAPLFTPTVADVTLPLPRSFAASFHSSCGSFHRDGRYLERQESSRCIRRRSSCESDKARVEQIINATYYISTIGTATRHSSLPRFPDRLVKAVP